MLIKVNPHKLEIIKEPVNEREIDITKCKFEFAEEITQEYVKEAYFTFNGTSYKVIIQNDECDIPNEVLTEKGQVELGVVCFLVENETEIKRYNPSPAYFNTWIGSLKDNPENSEQVTPSDKEQMEQALQTGLNDIDEAVENASRLNISAEKVEDTTTITITKQDGTQTTTEINDGVDGQDGTDGQDGVSLEYKWSGTNLGIKREDEQNYEFVNLKGDTGAPGQIKFTIVNELPLVGDQDTIYLVPYEDAETGNNYKEYIYVNGAWEELGSVPVEVDLDDYYTKQEVNNLIPTSLSELTDDATHRLTTDTEKTTWNGKSDKFTILSYGSSTWNDFITAYNNNSIVYCRAGTGNNPASPPQSRMAFMGYLTLSGQTPTAVEFQYFRNIYPLTSSNPNAQIIIYKLTSSSGGTWSYETREVASKINNGTGTSASYTNGVYRINISSASSSAVGGIKTSTDYATGISSGVLTSETKDYTSYGTADNNMFISKGTLENVLTNRIGDIDTALDLINGEVL